MPLDEGLVEQFGERSTSRGGMNLNGDSSGNDRLFSTNDGIELIEDLDKRQVESTGGVDGQRTLIPRDFLHQTHSRGFEIIFQSDEMNQ